MHVIYSGLKVSTKSLYRLVKFPKNNSFQFTSNVWVEFADVFKRRFSIQIQHSKKSKLCRSNWALEYYSPYTKSKAKRDELISWHQNLVNERYVSDLQNEIDKYCSQVVGILRLCGIKFKKLFIAETTVEPFYYCTIALSNMAIFLSNHLIEKIISIVPKNMYQDSNKPFLNSSIEWLEFGFFHTKSNIKHN